MKSRCAEFKRARPLLGTIVEVTLFGADTERCEEAFEDAFAAISLVQRQMSFHDSSSVLSRINSEAATRPVPADDATFRVLRMAQLFNQASNGLFDPTIAAHLEHAGFLPKSSANDQPPSASFDDVELLPGKRVRFRKPGIRLDLGGIAKGFAVDKAVSALRRKGMMSGLVNAGGDLRAFGSRPFAVGIRDPVQPDRISVRLVIRNRALATSAHYFASRLRPGATAGPFVNPRLGRFRSTLASVSVAAKNTLVADALTKVVMLDPESSLALLQQFAAESLVHTLEGAMFSTPNWHEKLQTAA
ncbi:MAG TPA: FAD:protein FMN transferase [Chthoniobacterales bacterium]